MSSLLEKSAKNKLEIKLNAGYLCDVWENFCKLHSLLYELTCDEYIHLLASDLDKIDSTLKQKEEVIKEINLFESQRKKLVDDFSVLAGVDINKFSELAPSLSQLGLHDQAKKIEALNSVLIDIVEKLQEQNKKNQIYLNKALISLEDLKNSFSGKKKFKTYGADGATRGQT